jgi:hypothetical protein
MPPMTLLQAIARMEGWLVPTSRVRRNHNPGDIEYGRFAVSCGATDTDGRFAIFPDDATGFKAMATLLAGPVYAGKTLQQAISIYAPSTENDVQNYVSCVCSWTGLTPASVITPELLTT